MSKLEVDLKECVKGTTNGWGAHRRAWENTHGPIPPGMYVLHHCDNPPCVNPDHLFLGTHDDNMADKVAKGRQAKGADCKRSTLTDGDIEIIREIASVSAMTDSELAHCYGVTRAAITHIVSGRTWKHVPHPAPWSTP